MLSLPAIALPLLLPALQDATPEPVRVRVPGSTAELTFLPLPADPDAPDAPRPRLARTELPWEAYDPWFLALDVPADERVTLDAESRPSKPYGAVDRGFGHDGYPAIGMTARAAELYAEWLSERTGGRFRLPTEAEWERAARAVDTSDLEAVAWVFENSNDQTRPVATRKPSPHGFHDLLGNAGEWCTTPEGGHVLRGGSYYDFAEEVSPATRVAYDVSWQRRDPQIPKSAWWLSDGPFVGLRLVCEVPPPDPDPDAGPEADADPGPDADSAPEDSPTPDPDRPR
jgi:hypothetical protein